MNNMDIMYGERSFIKNENLSASFLEITSLNNKPQVINLIKDLQPEKFENLQSFMKSAKLDQLLEKWSNNKDRSDENFWQKLFEENMWILQQVFSYPILILQGETYVGGKNTQGRNGQGGVATDFFGKDQFTNSFAIVEIKTPGTKLIGSHYRGTPHSNQTNAIHSMSPDMSGGIVQLQTQLNTAIEDFKCAIDDDFRDHNLNCLNPHGVLIIGDSSNLTKPELKSLTLFRRSISGISIFTFNELFEKLKQIREILND